MSPWWLRPTAESDKPDAEDAPRAARAAKEPHEKSPSRAAPDAADEGGGKDETSDKPDRSTRRGGRKRGGRGRRPAADEGDAKADEKPAEEPVERPKESSRPRGGGGGGGRGRERAQSGEASTPRAAKERSAERPERPERKSRGGAAAAPVTHDITVEDITSIHRELTPLGPQGHENGPVPERTHTVNDERKIAMFCDLENIALGVRDSDIKKFDINLVLERLLEKGKIIVKRAYCDWERYSEYKRPFHEAAIEMLDIPQKYYSGKNSADIKMVVDAMDLCYAKEHLDTFALLSGDSDFSPLVSKLKENDKYVIGIGVKNSSSNLLIDNCDEFIYYEDIWRDQGGTTPQIAGLGKKSTEVFSLMIESIQALVRENKDVLWGSMIKQTMQRKRPSFNEGYYGYGSFSELLEDAEKKNILKLKKDQRSGSYVVTGFSKR